MKRPCNLPECEHGRVAGSGCNKCRARRLEIEAKVKPLVDEFWDHRGDRELDHLFYRAYRMGMEHRKEECE